MSAGYILDDADQEIIKETADALNISNTLCLHYAIAFGCELMLRYVQECDKSILHGNTDEQRQK